MRLICWIEAHAYEGPVVSRAAVWFLFWPLLVSLRVAGLGKHPPTRHQRRERFAVAGSASALDYVSDGR
jgi:hypothetical protein